MVKPVKMELLRHRLESYVATLRFDRLWAIHDY